MAEQPSEPNYCGCCGNEIGRSTRSDPEWCNRCARHVARSHRGYTALFPWEKTYQARTGLPCPFQVPIAAQNAPYQPEDQ